MIAVSYECNYCHRFFQLRNLHTIISIDNGDQTYICMICMLGLQDKVKYPDCKCGHMWVTHIGSYLYCYSDCDCHGYEPEKEIMARLPDTKTHDFRFEIPSSNGKKLYTISRCIANKQWQCSCTGWIAHRHCKHLRQTEAERMKLEKAAFGAKNKDYNGAPGTADDWKGAIASALPELEAPKIETVTAKVRKFKLKDGK